MLNLISFIEIFNQEMRGFFFIFFISLNILVYSQTQGEKFYNIGNATLKYNPDSAELYFRKAIPFLLEEEKGVKIFFFSSSVMPTPLSIKEMATSSLPLSGVVLRLSDITFPETNSFPFF